MACLVIRKPLCKFLSGLIFGAKSLGFSTITFRLLGVGRRAAAQNQLHGCTQLVCGPYGRSSTQNDAITRGQIFLPLDFTISWWPKIRQRHVHLRTIKHRFRSRENASTRALWNATTVSTSKISEYLVLRIHFEFHTPFTKFVRVITLVDISTRVDNISPC